MERIYPAALPRRSENLHQAAITAAGGEHEAFQLMIAAPETELKDLTITVGDFVNSNGDKLPAEVITASPVGYFYATDQLRHHKLPDSIPDFKPSTV